MTENKDITTNIKAAMECPLAPNIDPQIKYTPQENCL